MGFWRGATAVEGFSEEDRRGLVGNAIDMNAMVYLMTRLPARGTKVEEQQERRHVWAERGARSQRQAELVAAWAEADEEAQSVGAALPVLPPSEASEESCTELLDALDERPLSPEGTPCRQSYGAWLAEVGMRVENVWRAAGVRRPGEDVPEEGETEELGEGLAPEWEAWEESTGSRADAPTWLQEAYPRWSEMEEEGVSSTAPEDPKRWVDERTGLKLKPVGWWLKGCNEEVLRMVGGEAEFIFDKEPESNTNKMLKVPKEKRNLPSCQEHLDKVLAEIDKYETEGMSESFPEWVKKNPGRKEEDFVKVVHRWGATTKKDTDEIRPYLDCTGSGLNGCMAPWPMKLPTPESVARDVPANWVLGSRDWRHGFMHVVGGENMRRTLGFFHPVTGELRRYTVLPFGPSQAPAIFWTVVLAAMDIFRAELAAAGLGHVRLYAYADDVVLAAPNLSDMRAAFKVLDEVAQVLGITFKSSKDVGKDEALQELSVWGLLLKTAGKVELRVPEDKRTKYGRALAEVTAALSEKGEVEMEKFESLLGKLAFTSRATRWGRGFMDEMWDAKCAADTEGSKVVRVNPRVLEDLKFWERLLGGDTAWEGRTVFDVMGATDMVQGVHYARFSTDASGDWGWGAVWESERAAGTWTSEEESETICWKELFAILQALRLWGAEWRGRGVRGASDNMAARGGGGGEFGTCSTAGRAQVPPRNRRAVHEVQHPFVDGAHCGGAQRGARRPLARKDEAEFQLLHAPGAVLQGVVPKRRGGRRILRQARNREAAGLHDALPRGRLHLQPRGRPAG